MLLFSSVLFEYYALVFYQYQEILYYFGMAEIEELSQFLTLETRLDLKALALQQLLGNFSISFRTINFYLKYIIGQD